MHKQNILKSIILVIVIPILFYGGLYMRGTMNYDSLMQTAEDLCSGIDRKLGEGGVIDVRVSRINNAVSFNRRIFYTADGSQINPHFWWVDDWKLVCAAIS